MAESTSFPLQGSCFCRAITFTVTSPPILKAYCHCSDCQRLTGCPFVHTVHFPQSSFTWMHPNVETALDTYVIPSKSWKTRYRCKTCGTCIASHNAEKKKWSVWGAVFGRDEQSRIDHNVWEIIKPDAHIFYGTRMLDVNDDLGKWEGYKDTSERLG